MSTPSTTPAVVCGSDASWPGISTSCLVSCCWKKSIQRSERACLGWQAQTYDKVRGAPRRKGRINWTDIEVLKQTDSNSPTMPARLALVVLGVALASPAPRDEPRGRAAPRARRPTPRRGRGRGLPGGASGRALARRRALRCTQERPDLTRDAPERGRRARCGCLGRAAAHRSRAAAGLGEGAVDSLLDLELLLRLRREARWRPSGPPGRRASAARASPSRPFGARHRVC